MRRREIPRVLVTTVLVRLILENYKAFVRTVFVLQSLFCSSSLLAFTRLPFHHADLQLQARRQDKQTHGADHCAKRKRC
jgi:hypothetical protein